jgi:hypothetical protein
MVLTADSPGLPPSWTRHVDPVVVWHTCPRLSAFDMWMKSSNELAHRTTRSPARDATGQVRVALLGSRKVGVSAVEVQPCLDRPCMLAHRSSRRVTLGLGHPAPP